MSIAQSSPITQQLQKRDSIIDYLLRHSNPFHRTQIEIMRNLGISQATLVRYLAELKGEGLILERPFGTAVIYEIQYEIAVARGLTEKFKIFDLNEYLKAKNQPINQEWVGKVFNFGDAVYIYARHQSGFTLGIPIYDKDWKELVQAVAMGLSVEAFFSALVSYAGQK